MKSFRDATTGVLKAYGYCDSNAPGDSVQDEPEGFALEPGKWRLAMGKWVENAPAAQTKDEKIAAMLAPSGASRLLVQLTIQVLEDQARVKAVALGMTEVQALAYLRTKNSTYRQCKDMEAACLAIEAAAS